MSGTLAWPTHPAGFVVLAHEGGPPNPRIVAVARRLRASGLGTLLLNLGGPPHGGDRGAPLDADGLTRRLLAAAEWLASQPEAAGLSLGLLGTSAGAVAALRVAEGTAIPIGAIVSCGSCTDLPVTALDRVRAPTLLLAGAGDPEALERNRQAYRRLGGPKRLVVIPGAGAPFEEPGTLDQIGHWAAEWFVFHLALERAWRAARGAGSGRRPERHDQQRQSGLPHQLGGDTAEQRAIHPGEAVRAHHKAVRPG
jgi:putative phosphoribosyl transferase